MPTSVTGTSNSRRVPVDRGFTLLEVLIVVVIIGIIAGSAAMSVGMLGRDRTVERETQRLGTLIGLLREEALMQSRDYGVLFTQTGYRFYVYDYADLAWVRPQDDRLLADRPLEDPLLLALSLEDQDVVLPERLPEEMPPAADGEVEADDTQQAQPQVTILSSGEMTPFVAAIQRGFDGARFTLTAAFDGTVETVEDDGF